MSRYSNVNGFVYAIVLKLHMLLGRLFSDGSARQLTNDQSAILQDRWWAAHDSGRIS